MVVYACITSDFSPCPPSLHMLRTQLEKDPHSQMTPCLVMWVLISIKTVVLE